MATRFIHDHECAMQGQGIVIQLPAAMGVELVQTAPICSETNLPLVADTDWPKDVEV